MGQIRKFDILIIGGGSGLTAAYHAEKDGRKVALVEAQPDALGGTCTNRGCIPTKGLIESAEVMDVIRRAGRFGIEVSPDAVRVDFPGIMDSIRRRRREDVSSVRSWVDKSVTLFGEKARFVDDRTVETESGERIQGDEVFLATGARPGIPEIPGIDELPYWTNETALEQTQQPESLIILGGGYVASEFGYFYSSLGTQVTVVESGSTMLEQEDREVRSLFTEEFKTRANVLLETEALEAVTADRRMGFRVRRGDQEETVLGEAVLVAAGRRPNTEDLELGRTGVEVDERGWVKVDEFLQTTHPNVYAYGDVIGRAMFKHTSSYEGRVAYRNSQGAGEQISYHANPHAVFSSPQIGSVGLTEQVCAREERDFRCVRKEISEVAKGRILHEPPGFAKLLVDNTTDRILGFHMIGPRAADLVHEVVVAMNAPGGSARTVRDSIHIHPTLPELIHGVFESID